ncbi:MAG: MATE family efflux transporter [Coprobacillaceae bacterium]
MKKYIANKKFYILTGKMMIPIAIQSIINSLSGLIDTMMASHFNAVSAVGIALQVDNIMQCITFGIAAGVNIFVVQYFGAKEYSNMKKCFGLSVIIVSINALVWMALSLLLNTKLLGLYMNDMEVVTQAFEYLQFSCLSFVFTSIVMTFTFAYHSVQRTQIPLIISIIVMVMHVILNYILMFVIKLGVAGAGISMTITQVINLMLYIGYSIYTKQPFIGTLKEMFIIPKKLVRKVIKKIYPLAFNECLFGIGNSMFIVAYGVFGKSVMDCYYIGNQIVTLFYTVVNAMSDAATSLIGLELGKQDYDMAEQEVNYFFGITTVLSIFIIGIILVFAPNIVSLFEVENQAAFVLSVSIIRVLSIRIAFRLFNVIIFASLRAGGDSRYLAFLDSMIMWGVVIAISFVLIYHFKFNDIVLVILIGQIEQLVRLILGMRRMKSKKWMNTML